MTDDIYINALKKYFGYDSFRSIQLDIIKSISTGHDTLGLMPTGGGKSFTFQIPALLMEGVCIVVTPLVALMNDQVAHLKAKGIRAETVNSEMSRDEIIKVLDNAIYGAVKFLYISPERLGQQLFLYKLRHMQVCFLTIDEAHCISQWGYDFRPSYLRIGEIRKELPNIPVLALTATATPPVVTDIQEKLLFGQCGEEISNVFTMSFKRDNISYVVRQTEDKEAEIIHILKNVSGCAIVYTRSRSYTKAIAKRLEEAGISATFFHAGLDFAVKNQRQLDWQNGTVRVMVSTNAFGMGIDKSDVRLVIHADCPDSLEAYYQEAGRAGRDGSKSYAILLYNKRDHIKLCKSVNEVYPEKDYIRRVYDHLAYYFELAVESGQGARYEFNEDEFCFKFHHFPTFLHGALSILQNSGYIEYNNDPESHPRVKIIIGRDELYYVSNMTETENLVMTTLMRYYGSLFIDFVFINENFISRKIGITSQKLRVTLKQLSQRGILRYIPRRNVPVIIFTKQRIDSDRLIIKKEVYEDQKKRYEKRIASVIDYAESIDYCRQRMLLEYFGEKDANNCQHCDVCIAKGKQKKENTIEARKNILSILNDKKRHSLLELRKLELPGESLNIAIQELLDEEKIILDGPLVCMASST